MKITPSAAGVAGEYLWLGWVGATHPFFTKIDIIEDASKKGVLISGGIYDINNNT